MKELNKQQRKAVHTTKRFVYVNAGAGTGKTSVIEARVRYLIKKGVSVNKILILAFNTEVVNLLKKRFSNVKGLNIRTFHSLGKEIIECYQGCPILGCEIVEDCSNFITQIKKQFGIKGIKNDDILDMFSQCRENPSNIRKYNSDFQRIYEEYVAILHRDGMFDYPEFICGANEILQKKVKKIDRIFKTYQYIFVDESQDLSQSRFELLRLLIGENTFLFMVGDDDQQILEWAGIKNNILKRLNHYYPDLKIYTLNKSYRLTAEIAEAANNLICHNKKRANKVLQPFNTREGHFKVMRFCCCEDETKSCVEKINSLLKKGVHKKDIAVLVRKEKMLSAQIKRTGVYCSTIHKSKGTEFKYVFVLGVERGIFSEDREEERRVLFVAITRAKKSCTLTYIHKGMRKIGWLDIQVYKSKFIKELYK